MHSNIHIKTVSKTLKINNFYKESCTLEISNDCICSLLIILENNKPKNVLISADIIWFSEICVKKAKNLISKKLSISSSSIVLCASHTHGTPNPDKSILRPKYSISFDKYLYKKIIQIFEQTLLEEKILVYPQFRRIPENNFSINRRRKAFSFKNGINYKMQNLPNFKKEIDKNIDLIEFIHKDKRKVAASIIKTNCHPVASPENIKGADYIGYLKKKIRSRTKNIFFLQGFCGDIRPKIIKRNNTLKDILITLLIGRRFRKQDKEDSKIIGNKIYNSILKKDNFRKSILLSKIGKSYKLNHKIILSNNDIFAKSLDITIWNWNEVILIFINAEVMSGYNIFTYKNKKVICAGYSNGMIGYLPTKQDMLNGGYEVDKSRVNFNIKHRLNTKNESLIKKGIKNILAQF